MGLVRHLASLGAPVTRPVEGARGHVESVVLDGEHRSAVLFEWAPGVKPAPDHRTYVLLGDAAARIHSAADTYRPGRVRDSYDLGGLVDDQVELMRAELVRAGRYDAVVALGARLRERAADPTLDRGVCHMDLTLDNVHRSGDQLTVFDFDSAGWCRRAIEPSGVLRFRDGFFRDWLRGYRAVRPFSDADERAVAAFGIIGDLRNVVWKLGLAASSRGAPLLTVDDLPRVVDDWLAWEAAHL